MVIQKSDGTVEFRFYRPDVDHLAVAGDFNGWHETAFAMRSDGHGWWSYRLRLAPGSYEFRYRSDCDWFTDYAAFGVQPTAMGLNSVLHVAQVETRDARTTDRPVVKMPALEFDGMPGHRDSDRRTDPGAPAASPDRRLEPAVA
jgi:1,4-alpha-glucan branching enzyme